MSINIFFEDLSEEAQKRLLEVAKIKTPEKANWDIFPLFELYFEPDEEGGD